MKLLLDPSTSLGITLEEKPEMTLEEEDFAELDDATELLLFSLELLATDEEDLAELELATELLDSSLDELRMTDEDEELDDATELLDPGSVPGMTLEEEFGATLEEEPSFSLDEEEPLFSLEEELATSPTTSQEPSTQFNSRSSS